MKRMKDCLAEKDPAQVRYPEIGEQKRLMFSVQVSSHMVLGAKGQVQCQLCLDLKAEQKSRMHLLAMIELVQ